MNDKKKILILRACGIKGEAEECNGISNQAKLYDLEVFDYCPKDNVEVSNCLENEVQYDYIYLSSHGNDEGFMSEDGNVNYSWKDFGEMLCDTNCMKEGCIVMLSCCRGGLNQVAYTLFSFCSKIDYIVGPRQSLCAHDMLISFNVLLYNLERRYVDPIVACSKILLSTDIRFICFDRLETTRSADYIIYQKYFLEKQEEKNINQI